MRHGRPCGSKHKRPTSTLGVSAASLDGGTGHMTPRCPAYIGILPKGSGVSSLQAP